MEQWSHNYQEGEVGPGHAILIMGSVSEYDNGGGDAPSPGQLREPVKTALHHRRAIVPFTLAPAQPDSYKAILGRSWGFNQTLRPLTPLQRITVVYEQYDLMPNQNPYVIDPVVGPIPPYWCQPEGLG